MPAIKTVIYLDVLLLVNFLVAYFLLQAAGLLSSQHAAFSRMVCASGIASLSALILFAPELSYPAQILYKILTACAVVGVAFGLQGLRRFVTAVCWYAAFNILLAGLCIAVILRTGTPLLQTANLTVYLRISPVVLLLLFKSGSNAIGPIFNGISLTVRGLTLFGFCISVLQETTGIVLLEGLTPLAEIYPVIGSIGAFLAGILPFFAFVQRLLTAPLAKLAARLQLEPASITGLVVTSANCIPTLLSLDTLEERGITLNTAYAVVAAYSVGDFLAFTLQFSPAHALPMMAGRLLSGLLAVVLCLKTTPKTT